MTSNADRGYLSLVLHAHLPFIRHPEHPVFLEENWFYEAVLECYLPLIDMMTRLKDEQVPFRLTMSISPPLCEMLVDPLLQERFSKRLAGLIELSEKELARTRCQPEFFRTAEMYHQRFRHMRHLYEDVYQRDLLQAFSQLQKSGHLDLIACAGTHSFLPLMKSPRGRRAHIRVGKHNYEKHFGQSPTGMWLPECAYIPGLDQDLHAEGIEFFFLDSHGILFAQPRPRFGTFAPVRCPSGTAVFARDIETSKQVWSAQTGYPGDPNYREFYRDLGHDGELSHIAPYIHPDGIRHDLGIKYHRVTGGVDLSGKEAYDPEVAHFQALQHADDFLANRRQQIAFVRKVIGRAPLIVAPYDAELFGHWWYEGPQFLEALLRKISTGEEGVTLLTPAQYLRDNPDLQKVQPSASSWGDKGYFEVWLNGDNDWMYPHFHAAETRLEELTDSHPEATGLVRRALNQAARELMLAQSSDWGFILTTGTVAPYAKKRVVSHLTRFCELYAMLKAEKIDAARLAEWEAADSIFQEMDYRVYAK